MSDCTTTMIGRLGQDPELRFTTGGTGVANFTLAVDRRYQKNGEWQKETSWFKVTVWSDLAEHCASSLLKGDRVMVYGRLEQRSWETQEGEKRSVIEVTADDVGPALRWQDVQIDRTEREKPTADRPVEAVYGDEEPF